MWIPPEEKDPVVLHAPTRKSIAYFGGTRIADGCFVYHQAHLFNAGSFKIFLQKLLRKRKHGKKVLVIVDNARYHHSRTLKPWLKKNRCFIELLFLPPYSPDLNPIERVWKLTRRLCTHNQYFKSLDDLILVVKKQFRSWVKPNDTLRKLCAI
jgi:transposase